MSKMTKPINTNEKEDNQDTARRDKGFENFCRLSGETDNAFEAFGPLGDMILEFGFGDVYGRGGLGWRERQIATMSIQIAQGHLPQLHMHIHFSLNLGITIEEIEELILHTVPYSGFPPAMNAWKVLNEIKAELPAHSNKSEKEIKSHGTKHR